MSLIAFNKPFGVLCQFSPEPGRQTLKDYLPIPNVYPAGRLDADSEGLLLLTDEGGLQTRISHPKHKLAKTYWAQVDGKPEDSALNRLRSGLDLGDFRTQPCQATFMPDPISLWPRHPPIRYRAAIPAPWLAITIREGKNRQVRRMTAAIGHPTLRLVRVRIGLLDLMTLQLQPGEWCDISHLMKTLFPKDDARSRHSR